MHYIDMRLRSLPLFPAKNTDMELINKLESVPNKQGYIKSCIKKMIELEQKDLL